MLDQLKKKEQAHQNQLIEMARLVYDRAIGSLR